jgi:hypothetical protein
LPPVPEAAEYELSDNTSSSSTLHDDIQTTTETEYHIEHGKVSSLAKKSKKFSQAPVMQNLRQQSQYNSSGESGSSASYFENKMCFKYESGNSEMTSDTTVCLNLCTLFDKADCLI